jgi:molybdopterin biosynthesis enzyme
LSGNPPAAFVNAKVLLLPAIRKMLQVQDQGVRQMSARLYQAPNKRKVKHTRFLTGCLFTHQGEWWIDVGGDQSAGSMSRFVSANALVRVEPGDELQDGGLVTVELW